MQIEEINIEGKKIGTHEVSDKIFSLKPRKDLIQLVINWQMNEQMKKKGHTKSRGEVKGSRRDRKSTRLNSSHPSRSRMPSSA